MNEPVNINLLIILLSFVAWITIWLLLHFASKETPHYCLFLTFIAWFFCFATYVVLPIDIYQTVNYPEQLHRPLMESLWVILYWGNFTQTWIILPIFMEYEESGEFDRVSRFKRSLLINLLWLIGYILIALIGMIFGSIFFNDFSQMELKPILMASANTFGLLLMMVCLGFSLVNIPQELLKGANLDGSLKLLSIRAAKCQRTEKNLIQDQRKELRLIHTVYQKDNVNHELRKKLENILNSIPEEIMKQLGYNLHLARGKLSDQKLGDQDIVKINKKIRTKISELSRWKINIKKINQRAFLVEDILETRYSFNALKKFNSFTTLQGFIHELRDKFKLFLEISILPKFKFCFGILMAFFSVLIIFGQVLRMFGDTFEDVLKSLISGNGKAVFMIWFTILFAYGIVSIHYSIFNVRIEGSYGLYGDNQTDVSSQLYSSTNFSRVSSSICFNYLQIQNISNTSFNKVIGKLNLIPLFGNSFPKLFPILLVILVLVQIFNIHGKVLNFLGINSTKYESYDENSALAEGKKILTKVRISNEKKKLRLNRVNLENFQFNDITIPEHGGKLILVDTNAFSTNNQFHFKF